MKTKYIRREKASDMILNLMMWAVSSILVTRAFLYLTNNPSVSFGEWHIAHMLWGGLFMLLGFLLLVVYTGRRVFGIAVALEGIGWGLFIDEIGKFLTRDNDYWFRPAIIFIYVSFILIFILYRYLEKQQKHSVESKLFGLVDSLEEIVNHDLEKSEKELFLKKANEICTESQEKDVKTIALTIKNILFQQNAVEDREELIEKVVLKTKQALDKILTNRFVKVGLWAFATYWAINRMVDTAILLGSEERLVALTQFFEGYVISQGSDIYMMMLKILFDLVAAVMFGVGAILFWTKKRVVGLRYFRLGLLVSIFLSAIFKFYFEQFSGVFDLAVSIVGYNILSRYINNLASKNNG